jgi:hypothetical protein
VHKPSIIERTVLAVVRRGGEERYRLDGEGAARIERVLSEAVEGANAAAELRRLLELIVAFETQLESPSVAIALERIVRANAAAGEVITRRILRSGALDETRAFKANEGRLEPLIAPAIDGPTKEETMKLADLLDPAGNERIRHRRGALGGAHGSHRSQSHR